MSTSGLWKRLNPNRYLRWVREALFTLIVFYCWRTEKENQIVSLSRVPRFSHPLVRSKQQHAAVLLAWYVVLNSSPSGGLPLCAHTHTHHPQMSDISPPVISLHPLRGPEELNKSTRRAAVGQIEASFKKFGCVCIPVSDLDIPDEEVGSKQRASNLFQSMRVVGSGLWL